jgi:predicted nucleic acid binding AN1-type Zn finger protein
VEGMVCLYKKKNFKIYGENGAYIIHNTHKVFSEGHTHINNYHTAKWLIDLAIHRTIPNRKSNYFLDSLIRISTDANYIEQLKSNKR